MIRQLLFLFLLISQVCLGAGVRIIPQGEIERIRKNPSSMYDSFQAHRDPMERRLGAMFRDLSEDELYVIYCSLVAYGMAPYGPSNSVDLVGMLQERYLSCGNYPVLTMKLAEAGKLKIQKSVRVPYIALRRAGSSGHGFLFIMKSNGTDVYLDPTYGLVVRANFDTIIGGHPVNQRAFRDFGYRSEIDFAKGPMINKIKKGEIRPSELLYYFWCVDVRNRQLPLSEATATPGYQIERAGPYGYYK